jgi:hypothetical protein
VIQVRARQIATQTIDFDGSTVELVSHATWLHVGSSRGGFGLVYRRPVKVVRAGSVAISIVDPVMIARLAAAILVAALFTLRRF